MVCIGGISGFSGSFISIYTYIYTGIACRFNSLIKRENESNFLVLLTDLMVRFNSETTYALISKCQG